MIELGEHAQFIVLAYAGVAVVVASLVLWTWRDSALQKQRLSDLEARGIRRRAAVQEPGV